MTLPGVWVLSDRRAARHDLIATIRGAAHAGAGAIVVREKDLPARKRVEIAERACAAVSGTECRIMLASWSGHVPPGVSGVHVARDEQADPMHVRSSEVLAGRSCHDANELRAAASDALDYVTLSPVFATRSKPGYGPLLGLGGLADLVRTAQIPVVALGGIDADNARDVVLSGAAAVASMGAVMRADDPGALVAEFVAIVEAARVAP